MDGSSDHSVARRLAVALESLSRHIQQMSWQDGIHPAQWSALRYFASHPVEACTVKDLANHQGTNAGTASRTTQALVRKGLVRIDRNSMDRRFKFILTTDKGRECLKHDPIAKLETALLTSSQEDLVTLSRIIGAFAPQFEGLARLPAVRPSQRARSNRS